MQKKILVYTFFSLVISLLSAQEGRSTFDYLLLPTSTRSAALGGTNISIVESDVSLIYNNPALLGTEMDLNLNVSYLSYIADIGTGNVTFAKALGERTAWGVGVIYTNYGNMIETNEAKEILGDLAAKDICGNIFLSHDLTEKIRGGITAKFIYSDYAHNTAFGLGVDLGLSYYDVDKEFSVGLVGKNIGRQIKAYEEELASLPWDIQLGISKRLNHAPIRFSVTSVYLKQWKFDNITGEKDSFLKTVGKHLILGVDFLPTENFWIGLGYNIKRGSDLHLQEGNKFAGFSVGAGLKVKSFGFGCSIGQYHPSATSLLFNVTTSFSEMKL
jgi:opacity protein-like surface antigen